MPELPEVEVVRRGLAAHTPGRTIAAVEVRHPRPVRRHLAGPEDFSLTLTGRRLEEPRRRGKFLWWPLTGGDALLAHLGMSGQFRMEAPAAPAHPHTRVSVSFTDGGSQLRFLDQRMFGGLWVSRGEDEVPIDLAHVAADLFEPDIDLVALVRRVRGRNSAIKRVLLDQQVVSGIGNIYADEALWRARLHGEAMASSLTAPRVRTLLEHARAVMAEALQVGGTSFDSLYVNVNGDSGYFSRDLAVYGQQGRGCPRCGATIVREAFANRSSHRCPRCQPAPRRSSPDRVTQL